MSNNKSNTCLKEYNLDVNAIINVFSIRVCHDLLSPVGAMQLAMENVQNSPEDLQLAQESMNKLIHNLDIIRKAYGYNCGFMKKAEFDQLIHTNFTNLQIKGHINDFWLQEILRLLVWMKYKIAANSAVVMDITDTQAVIHIHDIYINEEEEQLFKQKEQSREFTKEINAYNIYLVLFLNNLTDDKGIKTDYQQNTLFLQLQKR